MQIKPFKIQISSSKLQELNERLGKTIWPGEWENDNWNAGPTLEFVKKNVEHLLTEYDWRKYETQINQYPQYTTEIDGQNIHFLHIRSTEKNAIPLLLIHGWPGSFVEFLKVIEPLTNPVAHGRNASDAFHLVIPSLPGFGFSVPIREAGWNNGRIANAFIELMERLGYEKYGVQGADAGAIIGPELARLAPEKVIGLHVNAATMGFIPMGPIDPSDMETLSEMEKGRLQRLQKFMSEQFGFNFIHSHRPQALAFGISDSPAGLLSWISELFTGFGESVHAVDRDLFLTNFLIYWFTGTAASSIRLYYENAHDPNAWAPKENAGVPTAVANFKDDVAIRKYAEQANHIVRWTDYDQGGHYAVLEIPDVWLDDVAAFFRNFR
ncbi:epoxide hydrolase [Shimazuella sp. AN120528]|uniref:epoxide hydrolase family protein n=1 Tax=Shimazuella soli TaxID=1892854 RepID=UPI001F118B52|nr:epoxide hydrolase family protein [Shimazuella soli]MCH5584524.1 epoxide hydrolase [Shimazuella soli]